MRSLTWLTVGAALASASAADGQVEAGRFSVTPRAGYILFDDAASIENAGFLGVEALYNFTRTLSVGATLTAARPRTVGEDFVSALAFGDTTFLYAVSQPITLIDAGLSALLRLPGDRFSPYLTGGAGLYTLYLDPQVVAGARKVRNLSLMAGAGVNVRVTPRVGINIDVRDLIFTDYDREELNPTAAQFRVVRFFEDVPVPPEAKSTLHNFVLSIGFSFIPLPGREEEGTDR